MRPLYLKIHLFTTDYKHYKESKMRDQPLVSVIMATYNRAKVISKTVENIFEQTYRPLEVIIVNDGSTDNTLEVLTDLQKSYDFKLINNQQNLRLQKSLNKGLQNATGKYIARIDDHDRWIDPNKTSKQVAFLEENSEFGLVGSAFLINDDEYINPLTDDEIRKQILMRCPFCHQSILMRNDIIKAVGHYDENLIYSEDWDMWLKIATTSKIANLPDFMVQVFEPDACDSLSKDFFLKQLPINRKLVAKYAKDFPQAWKAKLYHWFINVFFNVFRPGSDIHRIMQTVFRWTFLKSAPEEEVTPSFELKGSVSIPNLLVILPAFNEGSVIKKVLLDIQKAGFKNICVVDDGSSDNTRKEVQKTGAFVISHPINRGAGAAVQTGIAFAKKHGYNHAVLMDSDGQHLPEDINRLLDKMQSSNADIVVGNRFSFIENKVPHHRITYNRIANIFTNIFCKKNYTDTQSGFRLLNRHAIEKLQLANRGYGFCSEMLITSEHSNLQVEETPIQVLYTHYSLNKGQNFLEGIRTARSILWGVLFGQKSWK